MREIAQVMWKDIKKNKLCLVLFVICIVCSSPWLFNDQFFTERMTVLAICAPIYLLVLFKPKWLCRLLKCN